MLLIDEVFEVDSIKGQEREFQGERMTSVNPQKRRIGDFILYYEEITTSRTSRTSEKQLDPLQLDKDFNNLDLSLKSPLHAMRKRMTPIKNILEGQLLEARCIN